MTYSFKHITLNGGGTSNFFSCSILKLKFEYKILNKILLLLIYSSSLINFGLTDKNCSIDGI